MKRCAVTTAMRSDRAFTSSYVSRLNGAISPGRWHGAQWAKMIGATSLLNVTRADATSSAVVGFCDGVAEEDSPRKAPSSSANMRSNRLHPRRDLASARTFAPSGVGTRCRDEQATFSSERQLETKLTT